VNAETQGGLLILTGGIVARMALSGTYLLYVRAGMRLWLLASALVLLVLGALRVLSSLRAGPSPRAAMAASDAGDGGRHRDGGVQDDGSLADAHPHDAGPRDGLGDSHHSVHAPRVAWLLVLPVVAVVLVAPAPLGSFTAARQSAAVSIAQPIDPFPPLMRVGDEPVALPVTEFVRRAFYDEKRSLQGVPVSLIGMVTPARKGGSEDFRLARFMIACCAADAQAIEVAVHGMTGSVPPNDTWVEVVGRWRPPAAGVALDDVELPPIDLLQIKTVPQPENPYEG
jgi:uncharacterized repeat protein (TIGR03943 family)